MPPGLFQGALLPVAVIPEATKRRLEQQYRPTQTLESHQPPNLSNGAGNGHIASTMGPSSSNDNSHQPRGLPSRQVTDETIDDAFVSFILYCNPAIPFDTDTTELRKIFRVPPKSDGKNFSTFTLFELIRKLELKEIKTWAQLALDLGVEPPALDKGQSAQKVQQYAVRLKRWLHAMHVDAFFEYLLGKSHVYWTQVPSINDPTSEFGRDGVAPEEDLAIRALLPETRPKRGRRKAEDRDDSETGKSPSQRPRLDSPTLSEDFMMARASLISDNTTPATAHPDFQQNFGDRMWSATDTRSAIAPAFRWPPPSDTLQTPLSAYPQSALTPTNRGQMWNDANEPRSAITPNKSRRRRHGPAVSSAWPSNGSASSSKLRGRPPSNRNVTDGPFSTFPVNPSLKEAPTINLRDNGMTATPGTVAADTENTNFYVPSMQAPPPTPPIQNGRPSGLQLQVPQRQGGTVRLATPPPPVVLVNGQGDTGMQQTMQQTAVSNPQNFVPLMEYFTNPGAPGAQDPGFENFVSIAFRQNEDTDRTNRDALESHFICEILAADWYDATGASIEKCSIDEADKICKQVVKNLQAESSSTEAFLINLSALAGGPLMTRLRMTRLEQGSVSHYECHWKMRFGSIEGDFTIRATVHHGPDSGPLEHGPEQSEESWKKRYLDLQQSIRERDKTVGELKKGVLNVLVVSNKFSSI
ncbi:related to ars binding protein 2 [Phialocephala subalpina]|uniref:Related to ars binding protein 2 n=1 Tax=Phialocephala subalpina TaxID=576137 RepID=A0A1L7WMA9_9HELO|nr:related to ars binding protein 2 [Phialocephala subalpina]